MDFTQEVIERMCEGLSGERAALIRAVIEENMDLRINLDKASKLHSKTVEEFEQERYSLKNKMEMMSNLEQHYTEEVASLQEQLHTLQSGSAESKQHEAELSKLRLKTEGLVSQLESAHASERDLQEKLEVIEKQFAEYREEHESLTEQKSIMASEDYLLLQTQVTNLQENVEDLTEQLNEASQHLKILLTENDGLKSELLAREEDNEQMRAEISSYTNALEKSREEVVEYKVLLENMQMEKASHGEKGNSLFGELDDRRVTAEKMLVNTKTQCEIAKQQLAKERQQHHRLKVQMATMLQANNDNMGGEGFSRMETTLSQLRSEKEALESKLRQYETIQKEQMEKLLELQNKAKADEKGDEGEDSHTQFLIAVLQAKEEDVANLKKELDQQNSRCSVRTTKSLMGTGRFFKLETDLDKAHKKCMRLALDIEELRMKYEPEEGKKTVNRAKRRKSFEL
ncbi:protein Spindly-B-like [Liolophura sinensis]|uniref:protein Spindly-B-like n=1 Tax=Liolophura sinensis TaxID=3198878 RepID=UPI0031595725